MSKKALLVLVLFLAASIFSCTEMENTGTSRDQATGSDDAGLGLFPGGTSSGEVESGQKDLPLGSDSGPSSTDGTGDLAGTVIDPRNGNIISGVTVEITFPDGSPAEIPDEVSDSLGKFSFTGIADDDPYMITLADPNHVTTQIWTEVVDAAVTTLPPGWFVPHPIINGGKICGTITDALNGDPIPNVDIDFRAGINPPADADHPVLFSATTGIAGYYEVDDVDAGVYTGFTSHPDYMDSTFPVYALGAQDVCGQDTALSPMIFGDELRIILFWGLVPSDLDSHLWAPHHGCELTNPFHLYYPDAEDYGGTGCSAYFSLDLDDVTSNGPETTTIHDNPDGNSPFVGSPYRFTVQDYTNRSSGSSQAMSNSTGLRVIALSTAGQVTFYMPPNTPATVWSVFDAQFD